MEWVETTAATVEQAKDMLLDRLGVDEQEAEFEVLEEPKAGLFGRVRGQYRVRARIAPKAQRSKDDKRRRPSKSKGERKPAATKASNGASGPATSSDDEPAAAPTPAADEQRPAPEARAPREAREPRQKREPQVDDRPAPSADEVQAMAEDVRGFLDGLVREFGLSATASVTLDEEGILQASVDGDQLGALIGPRGAMMHALEEICRTRVQHLANGTSSPRLRLDVGGYRDLRRTHLTELVGDVVERVRETGRPHVLDVLTSSERKLVHDTAGAADGIATRSEGEDPNRRVAVVPE